MADQERVLVEIEIGAPVDDVWHALRDPDRIRQWFGWDEYGLDEEIQYLFGEAAQPDDSARVLEWPDGDRVEAFEHDGGSLVRVVRPGWAPKDGRYDAVDEGWITFVEQLRFLLEQHPGGYRRTVVADHVDLGPADNALLARLGLDQLGDVGSTWEVEHAEGLRMGGHVRFRSDRQVGLSVDQEGDALLVVAHTPAAVEPPHGTARFVLSLFNTDDDRAVDVARRWHDWIGA